MRTLRTSRLPIALGAAFLALSLPAAAASQVTLGARLGWNFSELSDVDDAEVNRESATAAGVYLNLGGAVSFQPELLISKRSVGLVNVVDGPASEAPFRQDFVEVPLLVMFRPEGLPVQPSFYGGASVSFETDCETEFDDVPDCEGFLGAETDSQLWAGIVGAGLHVNLGPVVLGLDARYNHGLTEIAPVVDAKWTYWTVGIEAGIGLGR